MDLEIKDFLDGIQTPTRKLGVRELRKREELWRVLWGWIDEEVKYFVLRAGGTFRVAKRDWKGVMGELGAVKFEVKELELAVYEKVYNYNDGKTYYEQKVMKIPGSAIVYYEHISSQELAELIDIPEVGSLEEEDALV